MREIVFVVWKAIRCLRLSSSAVFLACLYVGCGTHEKQTAACLRDIQTRNTVLRNRAIERLGDLGAKRTVAVLEPFLSSDYEVETRLCAAKALGNLRATNTVDQLVVLLSEENDLLREKVIEALGKIGDERVVPALVQMTNVTNVQLVAIWALGSIGHTNAVPALLDLLSADDKYVRYNARQALKRIGRGE